MTRWESQAVPTLIALRESEDAHLHEGILMLGIGERATQRLGLEFSDGELLDTLFQLRDLDYVAFSDPSYSTGPGASLSDLRLTGRGLQVLGEWPRFEALVSPATLAEVLDRLAQFAPDDTRFERAAEYVRRMGPSALRTLATGVSAQLIRQAVGLP